AYRFDIELDGSRDPVIKRTVEVPASYTFQELHYVLQYAFAWQNYHLHGFTFHEPLPPPPIDGRFVPRIPKEALRIIGEEDDFDDFLGPAPLLDKKVKLSDVYGARGRYRKRVLQEGAIPPMLYEYDFGDCWEHTITFRGEKTAAANRPIFTEVVGYPPVEDCGGLSGWEGVKKAFAAGNPTPNQLERRKWAVGVMGLIECSDPIAVGDVPYSPLNEVDIDKMNDEERWERHLSAEREAEAMRNEGWF
ncbi:MM3350-like domain-containing protein, partial [Schizophyllum commune]